MTINMTDKYQTRDGCEVRIYAVDGACAFPVHGAVKRSDEWRSATWTSDGRFSTWASGPPQADDLVLVPVRRSVWLNVYPYPREGIFTFLVAGCSICPTREQADSAARPDRIACIHVEFTEGEGLEGSCSQK